MAAPVKVRGDLSSDELRAFARSSKDPGQVIPKRDEADSSGFG